jgi:hypothetical protein
MKPKYEITWLHLKFRLKARLGMWEYQTGTRLLRKSDILSSVTRPRERIWRNAVVIGRIINGFQLRMAMKKMVTCSKEILALLTVLYCLEDDK